MDDKKNGRTFYDYLHEHPFKSFSFLIIFLVFICFLVTNGFNVNFPFLGINKKVKDSSEATTSKKPIPLVQRNSPKINEQTIVKTKEPEKIYLKSSNQNNIISGNNNNQSNNTTNVYGDNNGIIGNIVEKELTKFDKLTIMRKIEVLKDKNTALKKEFVITYLSNSNGKKFGSQVLDFLISQGYNSIADGIQGGTIKGFDVIESENVIIVLIGTF